jgi:hypothetical protein
MKTLTLTLCAAMLAAGAWADIPSRFAPLGRMGSDTDWLFFNYGQSVSGFGTFDMVRQQSTIANTYTNGPASGTTDNNFFGGVLAPNGKVIFVPRNSDFVGIYDPVANTYTNGPASGTLNGNFFGGVLAPNGKVIFVPCNSDFVGIYDPGCGVINTRTKLTHPIINKF